jgi:hypothetical protein
MVVAATNWTAILVGALTGATGVAAAWFGYLGARLASRTALEQSQTETAREREERLAVEREERRALYTAFLDVERGLLPALRTHQRAAYGPGLGEVERAALDAQFDSVAHALNALVLVSPTEVASQAVRLHRILTALITEERQRPFRAAAVHRALIRGLVADWTPARRALIDAMRADVASDVSALEWPPLAADELDDAAAEEEEEKEFGFGGGGEDAEEDEG